MSAVCSFVDYNGNILPLQCSLGVIVSSDELWIRINRSKGFADRGNNHVHLKKPSFKYLRQLELVPVGVVFN